MYDIMADRLRQSVAKGLLNVVPDGHQGGHYVA